MISIYRDIVIKGVFVVALLAAGGLLVLYPLYTEATDLDKRIAQSRKDLERHDVFAPEFEDYQLRSAPGLEAHFPVPEAEPVAVREIGALPDKVAQLALDAGITVQDVILSPGSLKRETARLKLQAVVSGSDEQFREFYDRLGDWPALAYVSRVDVQAVPNELMYLVEFWVHVTEKAG